MVILLIAGRMHAQSVVEIKAQFSETYPALAGENLAFLMARRNPEEVPLGHHFQFGFDKEQNRTFDIDYELVFVTQQFYKPFPFIPAGWHTLSVFKVWKDSPDFRAGLPLTNDWYEGAQHHFIADLPPLTTPLLYAQVS